MNILRPLWIFTVYAMCTTFAMLNMTEEEIRNRFYADIDSQAGGGIGDRSNYLNELLRLEQLCNDIVRAASEESSQYSTSTTEGTVNVGNANKSHSESSKSNPVTEQPIGKIPEECDNLRILQQTELNFFDEAMQSTCPANVSMILEELMRLEELCKEVNDAHQSSKESEELSLQNESIPLIVIDSDSESAEKNNNTIPEVIDLTDSAESKYGILTFPEKFGSKNDVQKVKLEFFDDMGKPTGSLHYNVETENDGDLSNGADGDEVPLSCAIMTFTTPVLHKTEPDCSGTNIAATSKQLSNDSGDIFVLGKRRSSSSQESETRSATEIASNHPKREVHSRRHGKKSVVSQTGDNSFPSKVPGNSEKVQQSDKSRSTDAGTQTDFICHAIDLQNDYHIATDSGSQPASGSGADVEMSVGDNFLLTSNHGAFNSANAFHQPQDGQTVSMVLNQGRPSTCRLPSFASEQMPSDSDNQDMPIIISSDDSSSENMQNLYPNGPIISHGTDSVNTRLAARSATALSDDKIGALSGSTIICLGKQAGSASTGSRSTQVNDSKVTVTKTSRRPLAKILPAPAIQTVPGNIPAERNSAVAGMRLDFANMQNQQPSSPAGPFVLAQDRPSSSMLTAPPSGTAPGNNFVGTQSGQDFHSVPSLSNLLNARQGGPTLVLTPQQFLALYSPANPVMPNNPYNPNGAYFLRPYAPVPPLILSCSGPVTINTASDTALNMPISSGYGGPQTAPNTVFNMQNSYENNHPHTVPRAADSVQIGFVHCPPHTVLNTVENVPSGSADHVTHTVNQSPSVKPSTSGIQYKYILTLDGLKEVNDSRTKESHCSEYATFNDYWKTLKKRAKNETELKVPSKKRKYSTKQIATAVYETFCGNKPLNDICRDNDISKSSHRRWTDYGFQNATNLLARELAYNFVDSDDNDNDDDDDNSDND